MSQSLDRGQATLGNFNIIHPGTGEAVALEAGNGIAVEVDDAGGHTAFRAAVFNGGDASPPGPDGCYDSLVAGAGNTWTGKATVQSAEGEPQKNIVVYGQLEGEWSSAVINAFRIE